LADKRKNNGAKKGENRGAGRKPKSYEHEIRAAIEEAAGDGGLLSLWQSTFTEARKGSISHQNTIYAYYYGKPKEHIDLTTDGEQILAPQIILSANKP